MDQIARILPRSPARLVVDGGTGLESAIAAVWDDVPVQRCPVHKHRNLLAHAPERLHEEITAPRTPDRMQLLAMAMAMARCVLPVPVPPTSTALR